MPQTGPILAYLAVCFVWGSTYLAIRLAVQTIPPLLMVGSRSVLAGALLIGFALLRGARLPRGRAMVPVSAAALLLFLGGQAMLAFGETRVESGQAAVLGALQALVMPLAAWSLGAAAAPGAATWLGLIAGFAVALLAGLVARTTDLKEDASLATFYLASLALGVTIVSVKGTNIDLLHVLFGNILAMDDQTLLVVAFNATLTLIVLAVIYRPLVIESVDPLFLRTVSRAGALAHLTFLALVVVNLVNGFQALGTLLAVGLMILPAGTARFWSRELTGMISIAVASAIISGYAGLVLSFQTRIPSGPAIILVSAGLYVVSILFGNVRGVVRQLFPAPHLEA